MGAGYANSAHPLQDSTLVHADEVPERGGAVHVYPLEKPVLRSRPPLPADQSTLSKCVSAVVVPFLNLSANSVDDEIAELPRNSGGKPPDCRGTILTRSSPKVPMKNHISRSPKAVSYREIGSWKGDWSRDRIGFDRGGQTLGSGCSLYQVHGRYYYRDAHYTLP